MQDKPLSAEEEETLSTEEWLGRVRTLKLQYFILRPTYKVQEYVEIFLKLQRSLLLLPEPSHLGFAGLRPKGS